MIALVRLIALLLSLRLTHRYARRSPSLCADYDYDNMPLLFLCLFFSFLCPDGSPMSRGLRLLPVSACVCCVCSLDGGLPPIAPCGPRCSIIRGEALSKFGPTFYLGFLSRFVCARRISVFRDLPNALCALFLSHRRVAQAERPI